MARRLIYDHGLPFSEGLATNLGRLMERIENRKASLLIIDGAVGNGKTTMAIQIMDYLNSLENIGPVDLEIKNHPQLSLGGAQFIGNFRVCHQEKLPVLTYDEAGDFNRRGSITRFNSMMNRLFETFRGFKMLVIICVPNFNVLDNNLFDAQIPRMLIHLKDRTMRSGNFEVYSFIQMMWVRYWYNKLPHAVRFKCYQHVIANIRGHFLDLPPDRSKKLDKLSTHGKKMLIEKSEINMDGLYSYDELMAKLSRSKEWVKQSVKQLKIKPEKVIRQKYYFSPGVLSVLVDYSETQIQKVGRRKDSN